MKLLNLRRNSNKLLDCFDAYLKINKKGTSTTYKNKYDVLTEVSAHTYNNKYVYSLKQVHALTEKRSLSDEHSNIFDGNTTATLLCGKPYEQLPISQ